MALQLEQIRTHILIAIVSDDDLMDTLVLKGGNALSLVHEIGNRASVDLDFSMEDQFDDLGLIRDKIFRCLSREFQNLGFEIFDFKFLPKPNNTNASQPDWWGGYFVEFKIIDTELYSRHEKDVEWLRRNAAILGPNQKRKYSIDISKNEYCAGKVRKELDGYTVYVYSLEMIAIEKLRAICQQMDDYELNVHKSARARDFFDIHQIAGKCPDLTNPHNYELIRQIFNAKGVRLELLSTIRETKNFHLQDWPSVEASIEGKIESFEYYFDFVVDLVDGLQTFWMN